LLAVTLAAAAAGCGGGGERRAAVTGTATRGGKPVADLAINFVPEKGTRGFARTDEQGRFTVVLASGERGAVHGKHKVFVQLPPVKKEAPPEQQKQHAARLRDPDVSAMLQKYGRAETTPIEVVVTGDKVVDLALD
jgi:hypothetical protein